MNRPIRLRFGSAGRPTLLAGLLGVTALLTTACSSAPTEAEHAQLNQDLIAAAWADDVELARELIDEGADVNHQDRTRQSAYLIATSEGFPELLELTLEHGADVRSLDNFNGTGLIRAAERGHTDIVQRLLETDIDVDHINNLGWTALHEAIILGDGTEPYIQTVQLLLDHGADPTLPTQNHGETPLELAQGRGQRAVAELLLQSTITR